MNGARRLVINLCVHCVLCCDSDLPRINSITISIYREADKRKKKDQHALLGEQALCSPPCGVLCSLNIVQ